MFARAREGDGNLERIRGDASEAWVLVRVKVGSSVTKDSGRLLGSSCTNGSVDSVTEAGLEWNEV